MPRTIRDEIRQTRPFDSLEQETMLSVLRTAAVLEHAFARLLEPFGITRTQYNVLRILRGAGDEGLCRYEVAERMVAQVPDVTRLLDRLEQMGLVGRARSGTDRRHVTTRITRNGLTLLARLDAPVADHHAEQLGHLGREKLRALVDLLAEARAAE